MGRKRFSINEQSLGMSIIDSFTRMYDTVWFTKDIESEHFELFRADENTLQPSVVKQAIKVTKLSDVINFYSQLVIEEDRKYFLEATTINNIIKNTENNLVYSVQYRRLFESGIKYFRLDLIKIDLFDDKKSFIGGFKDVDQEVRKEQKIKQQLNLRSAVIEALTRVYDSVWIIDDLETEKFELLCLTDDSEIHPSYTALKMSRVSDALKFYSSLVCEEDRQRFLEESSIENVLKNINDNIKYSIRYRRVFEKGERYYRLDIFKLNLENGESRIVGAFRDVDDEVRKDLQIHKTLQEAINIANASNKAKSDFLSSMSHDIRTPMNGIIGMTAIAASNLDDKERVADCLRKITESSNYLLSLINEVLDMNKIESGKLDLQEDEFSLAELIDGLLVITRPQIVAKEHSFRVNITNVEHEQVIGDIRRIQQVLVNILSNATKYTPSGGKISLSIRENPTKIHDFSHYQFIIEDNGYGMTEEFQKHLFEPFARANDKQTVGIQGTGLGMVITRNLVRMMGGDISVESKYGEGSRFTVNLYLKLQNVKDINYDSFVDLRVLVVDDDPVCCESTCEILNDMGMNSEWVLSGKAAVDRVKTRCGKGRDFFAVIIDWKLPDLGGVETIKQIRKIVGDGVHIIFFSAYDWSEIENEAREIGVNSFISKPLFRTKLAALFDSIVNNQQIENTSLDAPLKKLEELNLKGYRVLLAEDQLINAEIAINLLRMTGLIVDWVKDGAEAVEKMSESPDGFYSIFITDIQMPVMNGYEAVKKIRSMDRIYTKNIPIIAMSANAFAEDIIKSKKAGMNEHLAKPIVFEDLARVLNTYVK